MNKFQNIAVREFVVAWVEFRAGKYPSNDLCWRLKTARENVKRAGVYFTALEVADQQYL